MTYSYLLVPKYTHKKNLEFQVTIPEFQSIETAAGGIALSGGNQAINQAYKAFVSPYSDT